MQWWFNIIYFVIDHVFSLVVEIPNVSPYILEFCAMIAKYVDIGNYYLPFDLLIGIIPYIVLVTFFGMVISVCIIRK